MLEDDELLYNNPDYLDEDENEIDWNEQIYALEEEFEEDESDENIDDELDDAEEEEQIKVDDSSYLAPLLTDVYIRKQLAKPEYIRDRIKFYYNNELVYGHLLTVTASGKYVFDLVDISTGIHETKVLNGDYIDSF